MASNLKEAVENFKQFAAPFRAMLEMVDQITPFADIEQAISEADAALSAKRAEVDTLERQKIAALADASKAIADAKADADGLVASAKDAAAEIMANAKTAAAANAKSVMDLANDNADAANNKAADALLAQQNAETMRNAAQAELTDLQGKIDAAKAKIAKMLGAD